MRLVTGATTWLAVVAFATLAVGSAYPQSFGDGTHVVGQDIQPGIYWAPGGRSCHWYRLPDLSSGTMNAHGYELGARNPTVEVLSTDKAFKANDCGTWELIGAESTTTPTITASDMAASDNAAAYSSIIAALVLHADALHQVVADLNADNEGRLANWFLAQVRIRYAEQQGTWDDLSPGRPHDGRRPHGRFGETAIWRIVGYPGGRNAHER